MSRNKYSGRAASVMLNSAPTNGQKDARRSQVISVQRATPIGGTLVGGTLVGGGGGTLVGGSETGGTLVGGMFTGADGAGLSHHAYHTILSLNPHQFEAVKEAAAQHAGHVPSPMWGPIKGGTLASHINDYRNIMHSATNGILANHISALHGTLPGVGLAKAALHSVQSAHGAGFFDWIKKAAAGAKKVYDRVAPTVMKVGKFAYDNRDTLKDIWNTVRGSKPVEAVVHAAEAVPAAAAAIAPVAEELAPLAV